MKPLKLTMQAFGSYKDKTAIDFEKATQNFFLITGDTGSGKTTIFDALVFALYGEASSVANKKDGMELQSQFAPLEVEPFVELKFSEGDRVYTVRRVPRHQRPLKRGTGVKDESESVSLTMPDGREYPQKETDKRLEEIVGLTKEQFMQVGMIAQGEFMAMLRAKSDDKKRIFRKLFGTKLYQDIAEELSRRKKTREKDIERIQTEFRTEIAHVTAPEGYGRAQTWETAQKRAARAARLTVTDMEELIGELQELCDALASDREQVREKFEAASRLRDEKADACTQAEGLLKFFGQLEAAQGELAWCRDREKEIGEARSLITGLRAAYTIRSEYRLYESALKQAADIRAQWEEQEKRLPGLEEEERQTAAKEADAKGQYERERELFSKVEERVERSLALFAQIARARREEADQNKILGQTRKAAEEAEKRLSALEEQEKAWREQSENLSGAEKALELWKANKAMADGFVGEVQEVCEQQLQRDKQQKKAEQAKEAYALASASYERENLRYEEMRKAFLDEQAGFLADELKAGEPCPVCGSLEHPHPCERTAIHGELSREVIEEMGAKVDGLRTEQEKRATEAKSHSDVLEERKRRVEENWEKLLRNLVEKNIAGISSESTLPEAKKAVAAWQRSVQGEEQRMADNVQSYQKLQDSLRKAEREKAELKTAVERTREEALEAAGAWERSRAALEAFEAEKDYPSVEEAKGAKLAALQARDQKAAVFHEAEKAATEAKNRKKNAETLIRKYSQDLPQQEEQCRERKKAYEAVRERNALSEETWMALVQAHGSEEADKLQNTVDRYNERKASAEQMQDAAREAIAGREKPILEDRKREKAEAEEKRDSARKAYEQCKEYYSAAATALDALKPRMAERKKVMEEYGKLDSLYRRVSGNVTGSRMDLETYVQRYHLERILYAANRRFREMSAGQFELRLYDLEKAGEGKNRGLDLLVYSTVTGKTREIRTLSGGESFMAALSLSLGMADQIQESAAALNLDILFIDEGFGSLDGHSRNQAVRVLQEMAGGSRLVGIISHVTELKQEIDDQLIVRKDEEGSHVQWNIS